MTPQVRDHRAQLLGGVTALCLAHDQREGFYAGEGVTSATHTHLLFKSVGEAQNGGVHTPTSFPSPWLLLSPGLFECHSDQRVQLVGTNSPQHSELRLLVIPTSCGRISAHNLNFQDLLQVSLLSLFVISRYYVSTDLQTELRGTCHYGAVTDICFPKNCSELFVTCSSNDIRIWNTALRQEIIRIQVS